MYSSFGFALSADKIGTRTYVMSDELMSLSIRDLVLLSPELHYLISLRTQSILLTVKV